MTSWLKRAGRAAGWNHLASDLLLRSAHWMERFFCLGEVGNNGRTA